MLDEEFKTPNFSYLIGALADGSLYQNKKHYVNRVSYYQHSKEYLLKCIEPRILNLFGKIGHFYHDTRKDVYYYEITSKEIYQTYAKAVESFKSDTERRVPSWIREGTSIISYSFIRGFFDADGFYYINPEKHDYRVRFGQAEFYILSDIKEILSKDFKCSNVLGPYKSKEGVKPYYELHLYGIDQLHKFHEIIGSCHPKKQLNSLL
jgi:intein/homing endonuclease